VLILLATTNPGKIAEVRRIMGVRRIDIVSLNESERTDLIETGTTFVENALLKARHYHMLSKLPTVADDSGLEVDALDGAPGVYSARYAGPDTGDSGRISKLLDEMKDVSKSQRRARFTCVAAFVWDGGEMSFRGEVEGSILERPRGLHGFGYDPIFFYEPMGKTFAELTLSEKLEVSHRGRAFEHLTAWAWLTGSGLLDTPRSGDRIGTTAD
jgi:XTP/dITP diphosphohydrolase